MWKYSISYPSIKNYLLLQLSSQDEICPNGHIFKELFYSTICYISTIKDKLTCIYTWLIISSFSATWILTFLTPGSKGVSLASLFLLRFWNNNWMIHWFPLKCVMTSRLTIFCPLRISWDTCLWFQYRTSFPFTDFKYIRTCMARKARKGLLVNEWHIRIIAFKHLLNWKKGVFHK